MLSFPSIGKDGGTAEWYGGADVAIEASAIVAVEPREHAISAYHVRPQPYSIVHLSSGVAIEVFATSRTVIEAVEEDREPE